ncbi:MAG: hypothetical protein P4L46_12995 [Fimbriimonas sp.]|nr:hypothetical protein [Fimbriimonas sp.]
MRHLDAMVQSNGRSRPPITAPRRTRRPFGTTLVEVLVVIVVFLVGILAVIQIFPKGFQLLLLTRNKSIAQSLARETVEMLAARADELPEQIVSAHYDQNGNLYIDSNRDPNDLGPMGSTLASDGTLSDANANVLGNWQLFTGSNTTRRVIGEGHRVPAPGSVSANGNNAFFGGLMVLQFGPISYQPATGTTVSNFAVYGNDLQQVIGAPSAQDLRSDYQYFVTNPFDNTISLLLPSGPYARAYRVSFSAYIATNSGSLVKQDYTEVPLVSVGAQTIGANGQYPLFQAQIDNGIVNDPNHLIKSIDLNTLRVQRSFKMIPKTQGFDPNEPYEYKLLNENLGVLLFNPVGHEVFISRNGHDREPLEAKVNYDVYDWRVLHDDFRIDTGILPGVSGNPLSPQLLTCEHKLPINSLKVAGIAGPDGQSLTPILPLETARADGTTDTSAANAAGSDNFVLMDMATGGVFYELNPNFPTQRLINIDKSTGIVTINQADTNGVPVSGLAGYLLLPDGSTTVVQMDNRAVRALYMARQEFSVQVLKAASQFSVASNYVGLASDQYYIGGTNSGAGVASRIYFPIADSGRKVTVGEVKYDSSADSQIHTLTGQDFIVHYAANENDPLGLAYIDLTDADPYATSVDMSNGIGARSIKGASVAARVLWNPDGFTLSNDNAANLANLSKWGRGWRRSTNETYMQRGVNIR